MAGGPAPGAVWPDHARTRLQDSGHRLGGARAAVIDALSESECCVSASEVQESVRAGGDDVGLASVYRALELLEGLGLVRRVDLGDGNARFEAAGPAADEHHHHMVCGRCGRVLTFRDEALERTLHEAAERLGFAAADHEVVFHGTCAGCRER